MGFDIFAISSLGVFSDYPESSFFYSDRPDVYSSVANAGYIIADSGMGVWPSDFGRYQDALYARYCPPEDSGAPSVQKKRVPRGTDSSDHPTRAGAYVSSRIRNGRLPDYHDVFRNMMINRHGTDDPTKVGDNRWENERAQDKETDQYLRACSEIIAKWYKEDIARGMFARRMDGAWDANDFDGIVRALFDPKADGAYLKDLSSFIPGLTSDEEKGWEAVVEWFKDHLGKDAIYMMASEARRLADEDGWKSEPRLTEADRKEYITKVKDAGYTEDEAGMIVSAWDRKPEAEVAMKRLASIASQQENDLRQIENNEKNIEIHQSNIGELERQKSKKGVDKKEIDRQLTEERKKADDLKKKNEGLEAERAERFLQAIKPTFYYYGQDPRSLAWSNITDVPTAVKWFYKDQLGRNVMEPPVVEAAALAEEPAAPPAQTAGTGKGPPRPSPSPRTFAEADKNILRQKGYHDSEFGELAGLGVGASDLPPRDGFANWYAVRRGFQSVEDAMLSLDPIFDMSTLGASIPVGDIVNKVDQARENQISLWSRMGYTGDDCEILFKLKRRGANDIPERADFAAWFIDKSTNNRSNIDDVATRLADDATRGRDEGFDEAYWKEELTNTSKSISNIIQLVQRAFQPPPQAQPQPTD